MITFIIMWIIILSILLIDIYLYSLIPYDYWKSGGGKRPWCGWYVFFRYVNNSKAQKLITLWEKNGLFIGWNWVHANNESSRTSALLTSYTQPGKVMWRWALYYSKYKKWLPMYSYNGDVSSNRTDTCEQLGIPLLGHFSLQKQDDAV